MSVEITALTKTYGTQKAVDQLSFKAARGEILGFLGPNGAGKTTTMKMLTGYVQPSSGQATVSGIDVAEQPLEVRRRIGYLPEHNPLYKDMYVKEYLQFIAGLHHLKNKRQRVQEMIEWTGLQREQNKQIGALSKGYRQRVGLAQALIHDPEVLVLDEPTSGLDPNQLVEIRGLIKKLGQEKTVIFSTHIMQEVQAICDRVLIINQGKMVAYDTVEQLQRRISGDAVIRVEFAGAIKPEKLEAIDGVRSVKSLEGHRWQVVASGEMDIRPSIFRLAVQEDVVLLEMQREVLSVEDVFQRLTVESVNTK